MPRLAPAYRLHTDIQYVGKMIKSSKRRLTWKFAFQGDTDEHSVVLTHTITSGKKVIHLNGTQIYEDDKARAVLRQLFLRPFERRGRRGRFCAAVRD